MGRTRRARASVRAARDESRNQARERKARVKNVRLYDNRARNKFRLDSASARRFMDMAPMDSAVTTPQRASEDWLARD